MAAPARVDAGLDLLQDRAAFSQRAATQGPHRVGAARERHKEIVLKQARRLYGGSACVPSTGRLQTFKALEKRML